MPTDRATTLRYAEKLAAQGRNDQAILEYERLLDEQPHDWATANVLGDLYMRVGRTEQASGQFVRVADRLFADGFLSRANAFYKKILKLVPDHDHALSMAGEIAAQQGLVAEARRYLTAVARDRAARGDVAGAAEATERLASLELRPVETEISGQQAEPPQHDEPLDRGTTSSAGPPPMEDVAEPPPTPAEDGEAGEIDLTIALGGLAALSDSSTPAGALEESTAALDQIFAEIREESSRLTREPDAQIAYQEGLTLLEAGNIADAVDRLKTASRAPRLRFAASFQAARLLRDGGSAAEAIEWFERALEAPPFSPVEGFVLLFELADALEAIGESERALAICLELRGAAGDFRDVAGRIERLSRVLTKG